MSETNSFKAFEDQFNGIELPELMPDKIEAMVKMSFDPVNGAKKLHHYILSQSPDAREFLTDKAVAALNTRYLNPTYSNCDVQLEINSEFGIPDSLSRAIDIVDVIDELQEYGDIRTQGRFHSFQSSNFIDSVTQQSRPFVSICLSNASYIKERHGEEDVAVKIPNYLQVPVIALGLDYSFEERDT